MMSIMTNSGSAAMQPIRHHMSACAGLSGRVAVAGPSGTGLAVLARPWAAGCASGAATGYAAQLGNAAGSFSAQLSTAPASGPCASKQSQQKARIAAATGGEVGSQPPRDPV
jgi:hypothetical protein